MSCILDVNAVELDASYKTICFKKRKDLHSETPGLILFLPKMRRPVPQPPSPFASLPCPNTHRQSPMHVTAMICGGNFIIS